MGSILGYYLRRSLFQQVAALDHTVLLSISIQTDISRRGRSLPGAGFVIRPINTIDVNLSAEPLGPAGGGVDGSDLAAHGHLEQLIVPLAAFELVADAGDSECAVLGVQGKDAVECFSDILVVVFDDFPFGLFALREGAELLGAVKPKHFGDVPPIVEGLQEIHGIFHVFYELISKQAPPQLALMCLRTARVGEGDVFSGQLFNHPHAGLDVGGVVAVVEGVEEECTVGDHSHLAVGLRLEIVTVEQGRNAGIERSDEDDFFAVLEPVDLVEVGDGLHDVLGSSEMDALVPEFDGVTIAHEAAAVAGLDDDLAPVVEVSSPLKAKNSREVGDIRPPVDGGPSVD